MCVYVYMCTCETKFISAVRSEWSLLAPLQDLPRVTLEPLGSYPAEASLVTVVPAQLWSNQGQVSMKPTGPYWGSESSWFD